MKVEENIRLSQYFDEYGVLLSEGQQKIMSSYLYDDLTVSEIAQNLEVSRQAIMDSIRKAEKKLYDYEKRLGFVKKVELLKEENKKLKDQIKKLKEKE